MTVCVTNAQRRVRVETPRMTQLARRAVRHLRITTHGTLAITFVDARRMRALNKRFLRHDRSTDVLSFRYDAGPACLPRHVRARHVVGDVVIEPTQARTYATAHRLSYREELSRYVVHGLLHWLGHEDRTPAQRRRMRAMEDRLLRRCGELT